MFHETIMLASLGRNQRKNPFYIDCKLKYSLP